MKISFTVYGKPQPKLRARTFYDHRARKVISKTPEKTAAYENSIVWQAVQHKPGKPLEGPIRLEMMIYRSIPKSFGMKKQAAAAFGALLPLSKPDLDNYIKMKDAFNKIFWKDDAQVVMIVARKMYSTVPRVEFLIEELTGGIDS